MRDTRTYSPAHPQTEAQEEGGAVREHTERTHPDPRAGKNHTVKFTTDDGRIIIRSCCFDPHHFASPSDQIIHEHPPVFNRPDLRITHHTDITEAIDSGRARLHRPLRRVCVSTATVYGG
jgi:hypothetical protein